MTKLIVASRNFENAHISGIKDYQTYVHRFYYRRNLFAEAQNVARGTLEYHQIGRVDG